MHLVGVSQYKAKYRLVSVTLKQTMNKHCPFLCHLVLCCSHYTTCGQHIFFCPLWPLPVGSAFVLWTASFCPSCFKTIFAPHSFPIVYFLLEFRLLRTHNWSLLKFPLLFFRWFSCLNFFGGVLPFCQWNIISFLKLVSSLLVSLVPLPLFFFP